MQGHIHKRASRDRQGRPKNLWYVVVDIGRDENNKRRQKWHGSFRTRREADAVRARLVADLNGGTYVEPSPITFEEWVRDTWLPGMRTQVKPSTWDSYRRNMDRHLLPRLGHRRLRDLTAAHINVVYGDLLERGKSDGGGLSPKTVRYLHTTLHTALSHAVDANLIAANPAARAKPPKPSIAELNELRFWTPEQLRTFLSSVSGTPLEAAWRLTAMTGMRRGEVLGLRWSEVDFDNSRLSVRHTIISIGYEIHESTPKSRRARVIDLDGATIDLLREHQSQQAVEWDSGSDDNARDLVFCREDGNPIQPDLFSQAFQRAAADAGLPRIRLHDLRHTHATIALSAGVPVKVVCERLGHQSPAFTLKQYAHVLPGMQAEAAREVAAVVDEATAATTRLSL